MRPLMPNVKGVSRIIGAIMHSTEKKKGHYLGTEIDEKWWRRYTGGGLLARGIGEFWIDASALFFRRYFTEAPIEISLGDVIDVKVGKWHSGRWAGGAPTVKIVWRKGDVRLSSGFVFSRDARETEVLVQVIRSHMQQNKNPAQHAHAGAADKRCG
jgi:hypothetical protein